MSSLSLVFLGLSPRLYITRILVAACLCLVIYPLIWTSSWLLSGVAGVIALHHVLCLTTSLRLFLGWMDLILLLGELGFSGFASVSEGTIDSYIPEKDLSLHILHWIAWGCLILLTIFRLAKIVDSRGRALIEPFNMLPRRYAKNRIPHPLFMLLGRSLWNAQIIGETKLVRGLRGLFGLSFIAAISFWIFQNILYEPITETALGPVREFHSSTTSIVNGLPLDFVQETDPLIWNVIVPIANFDERDINLTNSLTVKPIWSEILQKVNANLGAHPGCTQTETPFILHDVDPAFVFFQFLCSASSASSVLLPDLAISVNFTALQLAAPHFNLDGGWAQPSIVISFGMTNSHGITSIRDILARSPPVSLIPGTNIAAPYKLRARQVFTNHALAAFGVFSKTRAFAEPEVQGFYPDPNVDLSLRDPQIATLRLYNIGADFSDIRIIIDQRMNSVIAGFSVVGGLWAALNGIFAFIFGASILRVAFGVKVLSIFGLAHSFHHGRMKEEALRLYPNIVNEESEPSKRGLLSLIKDHLIDLTFLEKEISYSEHPARCAGDPEIPGQAEGLRTPPDREAQQGLMYDHRSEDSTTEKVASDTCG